MFVDFLFGTYRQIAHILNKALGLQNSDTQKRLRGMVFSCLEFDCEVGRSWIFSWPMSHI
jgi:hypothetical protein